MTVKKSGPIEKLRYLIEINNWEAYYNFGIAPENLKEIIRGTYWETSVLILFGKILIPELKNAKTAKVELSAEPEKSDHWTEKPTIISAKAIGFMEIPYRKDILEMRCGLPPRLHHSIHLSLLLGKIKYVSVFGEKLKWRKGTMFDVTLSPNYDEDDY